MSWQPAPFDIADAHGPSQRHGYVYRGLGLHMTLKASPKGRRGPIWALSHLGSGHRIARITGHVAQAFPIASEIAECGDWTFDGLDGWRNMDPDLPQKIVNIAAKHSKRCQLASGGNQNQDVARSIALARMATP